LVGWEKAKGMAAKNYLALDLGAESGRGVVGAFDGERLTMEEVHRFPNVPVRVGDTTYWEILRLFAECKTALGKAGQGRELSGIGIDTWGVDFGLLGRNDELLGNPRHYRDHGNDGIMDEAFAIVPRSEIYDRTGIQFIQFNSIFQLLALQRQNSPVLENARTLLHAPDLLNFWFTGEKRSEFSIASTGAMIDPRTHEWTLDLLQRFGLPTDLLADIIEPGEIVGKLRPYIAEESRCGNVSVFAPAEHDTGSAVVAVPAETPDYAYLSSGTWSLIGIETPHPVITPETLEANFTNEGGAQNTIRLLKNVMGLWLVQECRRTWAKQGTAYDYSELARLANDAQPFACLIDPDAPEFFAPDSMPDQIKAFCKRTGQISPESVGAMVRCCLESLALKYRWCMEKLEQFRGKPLSTLHIVGGGTQNALLCQFAADATGRTVVAGPVEATAIGNILMQMIGTGEIANLEQARAIVRHSFAPQIYTPSLNSSQWNEIYSSRFLPLLIAAVP
jgi:rhamnulokinase